MIALGHFQRSALVSGRSVLPPQADSVRWACQVRKLPTTEEALQDVIVAQLIAASIRIYALVARGHRLQCGRRPPEATCGSPRKLISALAGARHPYRSTGPTTASGPEKSLPA
jgi:hypothetical protein